MSEECLFSITLVKLLYLYRATGGVGVCVAHYAVRPHINVCKDPSSFVVWKNLM